MASAEGGGHPGGGKGPSFDSEITEGMEEVIGDIIGILGALGLPLLFDAIDVKRKSKSGGGY